MERQSKHIEEEYNRLSHQFNYQKQELARLKKIAMEVAPIEDEDGNELPLKEELSNLPETITEIEVALEDTRERINLIHDNPDAMRRYEEQKKELEEIKERLKDMKDSKEIKRQTLQDKRVPWEGALDNITEKVNVLFSEYMKELGCAGKFLLVFLYYLRLCE